MDLALIGNCAYQALVDNRGGVAWLCWPRFDSSFVVGPLLDTERGGRFDIAPHEGEFEASQAYLPNTNVVRTEVTSEGGRYEIVDFAPRFRQFDRSYKPTMLVRRVRALSGQPVVRVRCEPRYDYGRVEPRAVQASNHLEWELAEGRLRLTTDVPLAYILEGRPFALEGTVYLVMTWGEPLEAPLQETCERFLERTTHYWRTWVKHLHLPGVFEQEAIRSALVLKLHQYEDTGAVTAAATTSLPEHQGAGRNWDYRYCWLRDAFFTLQALLRLGQFEEFEAFVGYLKNLAARSPGRLQPVYGITGDEQLTERELEHLAGYLGNTPVRVGNAAYQQVQHDVYGEMMMAIAPLFLDVRFTNGHVEPPSTRLVERLLGSIEATLEEPDVSLWEKRKAPRVHTFTVLAHWVGASVAARIARAVGDEGLQTKAEGLKSRAAALVEQAWRPELGYFADAVDTDWADASQLMLVNMGFLTADDPRATQHVEALAEKLTLRPHLLRRYVHPDGLGDTVSTFTVCGFWYAEALAHLGQRERATDIVRALLSHANHVGLLSEDVDATTGEQWGNFPQTYSHVGLINAAFAIAPYMRVV